jgi:uncharacterized protein YecT (DUF1311 family)
MRYLLATMATTAALLMPGIAAAQVANFDANYARYRPSERAVATVTSPAYHRCNRQSGGVTVEMRDCSFAEQDRVDVLLNANYRRAMARLSPARQQQLRASQRRWLTTRYNHCDNHPDMEGGTLDLIIRDGCVLAEVQRRTLWLAQLR